MSVGTAFAASDDIAVVNDEISNEESVLAVEDDSDALESAEDVALEEDAPAVDVVTNDTFFNYFDDNGLLLSNVTADELEFDGDFSGVNVSVITVDKAIKFTGKNAIFSNVSLSIAASNVAIDGFSFTQSDNDYLVNVADVENVTLSNNILYYQAMASKDSYSILANAVYNLKLINNTIAYVGNTDGTKINNAVLVSESSNVLFEDNDFLIDMPSTYVPWVEIPASSGNWVPFPFSEGILFEDSIDVDFINNTVDLSYNNVSGVYDTIYTVSFRDVDDATVYGNAIKAFGHSYIYGILMTGDNFNITGNEITMVSDIYYADGIDVEGPSTGVVYNNTIGAYGIELGYGIYSGMNGQDVSAVYESNDIEVTGYLAIGMSLGDVESMVYSNTISAEGNYTMGIASKVKNLIAIGNNITLISSEKGNVTMWEAFGTETAGVKVTSGDAILANNTIETSGFGVEALGGAVSIANNVINLNANDDADAYAIFASDLSDLLIDGNNITYIGRTNGTGINNAVYVNRVDGAEIVENIFNLNLVSAYVTWSEIPAGSGSWVSFPISEGIVIDSSDDVVFNDNTVNVICIDVVGIDDTIYAVDFVKVNNASIKNNSISALGNTYIYGVIVSGDDFNISGNEISIESLEFYANGIDIEGPASGVVEGNVIDVNAVQSVYGIYSSMNGAEVKASYIANNITGSAYNAFGFSLGDSETDVYNNTVDLNGNYTTGIAYYGVYAQVKDNSIILNSSEIGNESVWEAFGVESVGIKVKNGSAVMMNNVIVTAGKGVSLTGNDTYAYLSENFINVVGNDDADAYAIYAADIPFLFVCGNDIDYQGATAGLGINDAMYLYNVSYSWIVENDFNLDLVSSFVPWFEIPAGSDNWVSFPVSEGIVVEDSGNVTFAYNNVTVTYSDVVGAYDTIYAVSFKNTDNAKIADNNITALGHTYIYGIQISGEDFTIAENKITVVSDSYYANGIDIEGPASGVVEDNAIGVYGVVSAYGIYSGMNGADVGAEYNGNNITGAAYSVFGFSLGDVICSLENNTVDLEGNYSTGIAYYGINVSAEGNELYLYSSEVGNETIWESFGVEAAGIKIAKGTALLINNTIVTQGKGVSAVGNETSLYLAENFINVVANDDEDAYAVYAVDAPIVFMLGNHVDYQGATAGTGINNAVYIYNSTNARILSNKFDLELVSSFVPWFEIPAGSGIWVSFPVSEGIVVEDSSNLVFSENDVNVTYSDVVGAYDTIYAVSFKNNNGSLISGNNISALGHTYIYGIQISGDDFAIEKNNIEVVSDNYYANGIDIEGPAIGIVESNNMTVLGVESAYAIYSGMNGANVSALYAGNILIAAAYNVFGMSLGDVESIITFNDIELDGNYTTGIAYRGSNLIANNNFIRAAGSGEGDLAIWEEFGVENIGIKVVLGTSEIIENDIETSGNYAVDVRDTNASVHDNILIGKKYAGDDSVANAANAEVYNNTPIVIPMPTVITITDINGDGTVSGILADFYGVPIAKDEVNYSINGVNDTAKTDMEGRFAIPAGNGKLDISFAGDSYLLPSNATITLTDVARVKQKTSINLTVGEVAVGKDVNVTVCIPNATGNVSIFVNGLEKVIALDENGTAVYTIPEISPDEYGIVAVYDGDDAYEAAHNSTVIYLEGYATAFTNITIDGDLSITAALVNSLGDAIANATITYTIGNVTNTTVTDANGVFSLIGENGARITIDYNGSDIYAPIQTEIVLKDLAKQRTNTTIKAEDYTTYAIEFYEGERGNYFKVQLVDANGNPLGNKSVKIGFNGVVYDTTTNATGWAQLQINLMYAGTYTFAVAFLGDDDYTGSFVVQKIIVNKKKTSIDASAKTYKASAKTKSYTVTLKTDKGSSIDGKVYMKSGKKVTLKINGKTYSGKTNSKGQVTFKLSITKKGKFATSIKFAGDNTYEASSTSVKITIK